MEAAIDLDSESRCGHPGRPMSATRKDQIRTLLKGIESGDPKAAEVVHPNKYVQHNPQTHEGSEGLAALFERLSKTSPRVNIVRIFSDGDFVFGHTEYDFATSKVGFEVFRFEGEHVVEHWDNIQERRGPNESGRSMVDGPTEVTDIARTEANRGLVRRFVEEVLIGRQLERLLDYIDGERFTEHDPSRSDGAAALQAALQRRDEHEALDYARLHRVLAEGSFVLAVSEGSRDGAHSAFYDLFRVADGKLVEHWNTIETIAPKSEWKNDNGKF